MGDPSQRKSMIDFTPRRPEQVTLNVGKERLGWVIDAKSLEKSTHFSDLLKASDTYKLELPEEDPLLLRVYLHFLVTDELPDLLTVDDERRFTALARLCVYGANHRDKNFANAVINETRRLVVAGKVNPSAEGVQIIYDGSVSASPVRAFLIELFYHHGWPYWVTWMKDDIKNYPAEFLQDILLKRITENEAKEVHNEAQASSTVSTGKAPATDLTITDDVLVALRLSEPQIRTLLNTNDTFKAIIGKNAKNVIDKHLNPLKEQIAAKDGEIMQITAELVAAKSRMSDSPAITIAGPASGEKSVADQVGEEVAKRHAELGIQWELAKKQLDEQFEQRTQKRDAGLRKQLADGRAAQREQAVKEVQGELDAEMQQLKDEHSAAIEQLKASQDTRLIIALKGERDEVWSRANMKQRIITSQKDIAQAKWNAIAQMATQTPGMSVKDALDIASKTKPTKAPAPVNAMSETASKAPPPTAPASMKGSFGITTMRPPAEVPAPAGGSIQDYYPRPQSRTSQWQERSDGSSNRETKKRKKSN